VAIFEAGGSEATISTEPSSSDVKATINAIRIGEKKPKAIYFLSRL